MRKVSQKTARAFLDGVPATVGNTHTDGRTLYLHGNAIATRLESGLLAVTLAGWGPATTRERLNALPGIHATQRDGVQYINGERVDVDAWYYIDTNGRPARADAYSITVGGTPDTRPARGFYAMAGL